MIIKRSFLAIGVSFLILLVAACSFKPIKSLLKGPKCAVSIGVYEGPDPLHLAINEDRPWFTPKMVTDRNARSVADPFVISKDKEWYLFFEVINQGTEKGEIAYAKSTDRKNWTYGSVVLSEDFHLSYPYVFQEGDGIYMIPESRQDQSIRLYKATDFPKKWELVQVLAKGNYADPSIFKHDNKWWILAVENSYDMTLLYSDNLLGPWKVHPRSPIYTEQKSKSRPGGRVIDWNGKLLRFPQDGEKGYGHQVRAFEIDKLTTTEYSEHEVDESPVVSPSGDGWRSRGMHQFDAHPLADGTWFAVVDGCGMPN